MMEERIERKWEFVAGLCETRGYTKAAMLATKIDNILVSLYGEQDALEWKYIYDEKYRDKKDFDDQTIHDICNTTSYCIACTVHRVDDGCMRCKFGEAVGVCTEKGSLFDRFLTEFEDVADV